MQFRNRLRPVVIGAVCALSLVLSCAMGGSTEQGNARICGAVFGGPAVDPVVEVQLVAEEYNPSDSSGGAVFTTKTDSSGNYTFEEVPFGSYYLYAFDGKHAYTLLGGPFAVTGTSDALNAGYHVLQKAAVVTIVDNDSIAFYYIKGTSAATSGKGGASGPVSLVGVPAGRHDVMKYAPANTSNALPVPYTKDVEIAPGDSITVSHMNRPPRITYTNMPLPSVVFADTTYSIHFSAADPDTDTFAYCLMTQLESFTLDSTGGWLVWTPQYNELSLRQIRVKVADGHGACTFLEWELSVKNNSPAPTPQAPAGKAECTIGTPCYFTTDTAGSCTSTAMYRFSWGDGSTSAWSEVPSANYSWLRCDTFLVRVQVQCTDFASPSEWSPSATIIVSKNQTAVPSLSTFPDSVLLCDTIHQWIYDEKTNTNYETIQIEHDTISLQVKPLVCTEAPLYQFYVNGKSITGWTPSTGTFFTPESLGTYEFSAAAWCDTLVSAASERSKPSTVVVKSSVLPSPLLMGDTLYQLTQDTFDLKLTIAGDAPVDGVPVLHRCGIYNKYLIGVVDTNTVIAQLIVNKECINSQECTDTFLLRNGDTTGWYGGYNLLLRLIQPRKEFYTLCIQAELSNGIMRSRWKYVSLNYAP
jgi:hypothetical protein